MVNAKQYQQALRYFDIAKQENLTLLTGGQAVGDTTKIADEVSGYFVQPTIYQDVATTSRLWQEETFAPILACHIFDHDDEAVELTNASDFGLVSTIVTTNKDSAWQLAQHILVGHVWINTPQIVIA